ncbi:cytosine deaminase [Tardiphaga sp. 839_C3_N1_4]|jgi:cytosine deaminase|uniref:cytosine deaminase n=1 Tax=Tardiphaga sp. 839_C3_N1_4 TaxID=3240761 RepID=UPI003F1E6010
MMSNHWPDSDKVHVANVNVPQSLLATEFAGEPAASRLRLVDLIIDGGKIAAIEPPGAAPQLPAFDADGGQAWPPFADLHTHLDKGQIWPRASNREGTLDVARATTRADTVAHWNAEDVEARFDFSLQCAYAHGTTAIRTHVDCFVPGQAEISFGVFRRLRDKWSDRIKLQAAALVSTDLYDAPENAALIDLIAEAEGRLGGITFRLSEQEDPAILDQRLDRLFALATSRGLDVDLHVDENGSPASATLAQIAEAVLRSNFRGQVVCGHCCSLSVLSDELAERTIRLVRAANLNIVSLPLVNQNLQGRKINATPIWRGVTLLRELRAAGVNVALASDNCRDPYHPFGDLDLLEVYAGGVKIGHLDSMMGEWAPAVTTTPSSLIGVTRSGTFRPGMNADFQIFRGRSFSELLARRQSDRLVIRNGKPIDTKLPDFRTLDHLMPR